MSHFPVPATPWTPSSSSLLNETVSYHTSGTLGERMAKLHPDLQALAVFQPSLREPTFPVAFSLRAGKVGAQSGALLVCVLASLLGCSHSHGLLG